MNNADMQNKEIYLYKASFGRNNCFIYYKQLVMIIIISIIIGVIIDSLYSALKFHQKSTTIITDQNKKTASLIQENNELKNKLINNSQLLVITHNLHNQLQLFSKLRPHNKNIIQSIICIEYKSSNNIIKKDVYCSTEDEEDMVISHFGKQPTNQEDLDKDNGQVIKFCQTSRPSENTFKFRLSALSESEKYILYKQRANEYRIQLVSDHNQIKLLKNEIKELHSKLKLLNIYV